MRIEHIECADGQLSATVKFDSSGRALPIWFRSTALRPAHRAHPFIVGGFLPAALHGEPTINVARAEPSLLEGLEQIGHKLSSWWGLDAPSVVAVPAPMVVQEPQAAACFFTGGVDSMFTLHRNLRTYPARHPWRIRRAIFCYGFDVGLGGLDYDSRSERHSYDVLSEQLALYLQPYGVDLIKVDTNVRRLEPDNDFYTQKAHGVFLAAVAHALGPGRYYIGSTLDITRLQPWGSHPDFERYCSDALVSVAHDGVEVGRLEKLRRLGAWGLDLSRLHVCYANAGASLNCGQCGKCIRTRVELESLGLQEAIASCFGPGLGSAVGALVIRSNVDRDFMIDACEEFERRGNRKATAIVNAALSAFERNQCRIAEQDWRGPIKRMLRALSGSQRP